VSRHRARLRCLRRCQSPARWTDSAPSAGHGCGRKRRSAHWSTPAGLAQLVLGAGCCRFETCPTHLPSGAPRAERWRPVSAPAPTRGTSTWDCRRDDDDEREPSSGRDPPGLVRPDPEEFDELARREHRVRALHGAPVHHPWSRSGPANKGQSRAVRVSGGQTNPGAGGGERPGQLVFPLGVGLAPSAGFEPAHTAPEAAAVSSRSERGGRCRVEGVSSSRPHELGRRGCS